MTHLVFCAGAPNPDLRILAHLPNPILIGVDGGATVLAQAGYTPHWCIGDFDSAPPPASCTRIFRLPEEKNDSDLEAALAHVLPHYPPESLEKIWILGAIDGGRLDHLLANIWLAHQARFTPWLSQLRLHSAHNSVRFFRAGEHTLMREPNKRYLSFIGLTAIAQLTLRGVKYEVSCHDYPHPTALISNEFSGSHMFFSFTNGILCAIQSADIGWQCGQ